MTRVAALLLCLLVASLLLPLTVRAEFTPPTLVSGNSEIPFEEASDPALSKDGRYVAFQGKIAGASGIYRRDLQTGALELVASDAIGPSTSADGRFVAFTSTAELDPGVPVSPEERGCAQVYVRDMDLGAEEPGAYVRASALTKEVAGESVVEPIKYPEGCGGPVGGAEAATGVALSANGDRVVFTVLSPSDLTPGGTTGGQVVVRDIGKRETILVSEAYGGAGQAPHGGGAYPSTASAQSLVSQSTFGEQPTASSASISGDGSTVAWQGTDVPQQVPSATDVPASMAGIGGEEKEVEPLWRRIEEGAKAETKRLLGGTDLNFYFRGSHEETQGVEGGALFSEGVTYFVPPVLSEDGSTAVVIANAPTPANEASYGFAAGKPALPTDAYAVTIGDPASSPQVTPLTATPNLAAERAPLDGVTNVAISPDGTRIGFDSARTSFALSPPSLISPPAPETLDSYTYEVNLPLGTVQQVTRTFDGSPPNGQTGQMSLSSDDLTLAFGSSATNLIFGTPTSGVSQIYTTHELPISTEVAVQGVSTAPATPLPVPSWLLSASASVLSDGSVLVDAEVPAAGHLSVKLTAQVPGSAQNRPTHASKPIRSRAGRRPPVHSSAAANKRSSRRVSASPVAKTVAANASTVSGQTDVRIRLHVGSRYLFLLRTKNGLYCLLHLAFSAPAHPTLSQVIPLTVRIRHKALPKAKNRDARKRSLGSRG